MRVPTAFVLGFGLGLALEPRSSSIVQHAAVYAVDKQLERAAESRPGVF